MLYRSLRSISPWGVVPPPSHKVPRVSWYSGFRLLSSPFVYGAFTLFGRLSQNPLTRLLSDSAVHTPPCSHDGLGSSHFARRYFGNRFFFLFLRVLRCFSSPGSLSCAMDLRRNTCFQVGFPIQTSPALWLFAPPRGFSQLITSFFGSQCQGIHPAPLLV